MVLKTHYMSQIRIKILLIDKSVYVYSGIKIRAYMLAFYLHIDSYLDVQYSIKQKLSSKILSPLKFM